MMRTVSALAIVLVTAAVVSADEAANTKSVLSAWNRVKRLNAQSAEAMPEANFAFKPSADVRTFGQIIGHLANEHYSFCAEVKGEANPKKSTDFEKTTAKADLVKALNDSNAYCDAAFASMKGDEKSFGTLLLNVTHDSEHYGNLVTYLRMKGIVPPSSQPSR
jgi:uncharacterized damage-inducible protein DinB